VGAGRGGGSDLAGRLIVRYPAAALNAGQVRRLGSARAERLPLSLAFQSLPLVRFVCYTHRESKEAPMLRKIKTIFTPAEYLAMEEVAEYKSEYHNGEIFAMSGGTTDHSLVAVNVIIALGTRLAARPCRVFNSDMRLHIERSGLYTYPDGMVIRGKIELVKKRKDTVTNPVLLVEVLSESTRDYDRGAKFNFYKQIPTLQEYVVADSERPHVECYRRTEGDNWLVEMYDELDATVKLESITCEIPLQQMYSKVSWLS
jgi:Uma2 family endonuclease